MTSFLRIRRRRNTRGYSLSPYRVTSSCTRASVSLNLFQWAFTNW